MDKHECDECGKHFTSRNKFGKDEADVDETIMCDIIEGQYTEWWQVRCPDCNEVVSEWGR